MTGVDVGIVLVVAGSTLVGILRGFVREAVSVAFWVGGVWAAWQFGPLVQPHLGGVLAEPPVAPWVARLAVLVAVLLTGWLVGLLLGHFMNSAGLGALDRGMGLLFGLVRGAVLVGLLVIGGELLHLNHEAWWGRAKLMPYGEAMGDWLRAMVGEHGEPWSKLERLSGLKGRLR